MATPIEGLNTAVLAGTLSSDPRPISLESGSELLRLEVTTRSADGPAASVPVAWFDPPAGAPALQAGQPVVVVGQVRRRWFGSPGGSRSATEVVATSVVPAGRKAARQAAAGAAEAVLAALPP